MLPDNIYEEAIRKVLRLLAEWSSTSATAPSTPEEKEAFPKEDPRLMAMLKTKLQEALMIAGKVYNPEKLEVRE